MDDERMAALEARVAALEAATTAVPSPSPEVAPQTDPFWALRGLQHRLAALPGDEAAAGGVLFTGSVDVAAGHAEWQFGALTADLVADDWAARADTLAALGHPVRLAVLRAVLSGATTAVELQQLPDLGTSGQVYHHLRALTAAGWLRAGSRGRYGVPPDRVVPLLVVIAAARH